MNCVSGFARLRSMTKLSDVIRISLVWVWSAADWPAESLDVVRRQSGAGVPMGILPHRHVNHTKRAIGYGAEVQ